MIQPQERQALNTRLIGRQPSPHYFDDWQPLCHPQAVYHLVACVGLPAGRRQGVEEDGAGDERRKGTAEEEGTVTADQCLARRAEAVLRRLGGGALCGTGGRGCGDKPWRTSRSP